MCHHTSLNPPSSLLTHPFHSQGGDCLTVLDSMEGGRFPCDVALHLISNLILAVSFLHSHGIVHRQSSSSPLPCIPLTSLTPSSPLPFLTGDIKPDNLLITKTGHLKLMDFGMATPYKRLRNRGHTTSGNGTGTGDDGSSMWLENFSSLTTPRSDASKMSFTFGDSNLMKTIVGNVHYAAPEVIAGCGYDHTVDWWAVGVMYFHFLTGVTPFASSLSEDQVKYNILEKKINWTVFPDDTTAAGAAGGGGGASADCHDLINRFLTKSPEHRLGQRGAKEIRNHKHFEKIDFESLLMNPGPLIPSCPPLVFEPMKPSEAAIVTAVLTGGGSGGGGGGSNQPTDEFYSL
jgi:serine/threonine protein kinase